MPSSTAHALLDRSIMGLGEEQRVMRCNSQAVTRAVQQSFAHPGFPKMVIHAAINSRQALVRRLTIFRDRVITVVNNAARQAGLAAWEPRAYAGAGKFPRPVGSKRNLTLREFGGLT
jgi:hypothetical protein